MSNQLNTFNFGGKHPIRMAVINGVPVARARDIADALGYSSNGNPCKYVPPKWRLVDSVSTKAGNRSVLYLTEEGVYYFLCRSDKPKAKIFQEWFAGEVLPTIRKTGTYTDTKGILHRPQQAIVAQSNVPSPSPLDKVTLDVTALTHTQRLAVNAIVEQLAANRPSAEA